VVIERDRFSLTEGIEDGDDGTIEGKAEIVRK
jgi:hypothetical protein